MTKYKLHFFCDECSEVHPGMITFNMDDGPVAKESIGNLYAGKELPVSIATIRNSHYRCPNTKKITIQEDNNPVFLVPVE